MTTQNNKSTLQKQDPQRHTGRKLLFQGGFIVLYIALIPFIFYSYKSFPEGELWETSYFSWRTTYGSWVSTMWYVVSKVVPISLLLIWFFTCKHWWHWIILVPLTMYVFQLWSIINVANDLDEVELIYLLPLLMILVPFVYLIRAKLFSKIRGNDLEQFEEELLQKRTFWQQLTDLFR